MLRSRLVDRSIREARFNELLLEVIDDNLNRLFGGMAGNLVYSFLKTVASLDREDITSDLVGFDAGLRKLLGSGATVLEKVIVKDLYSRLGLSVPLDDSFTELIEKAKNSYSMRRGKIEVLL